MSSASLRAEESRVQRRLQAPTPRVVLLMATAVIVSVLLYMGRGALMPFVIGALLIYILDPAVRFFARLRIGRRTLPRGLAVLIVYVITFIVVVEGFALLLGPLISQLLEYLRDLPRLMSALDALLAQADDIYDSLDLPPALREYIDNLLADLGEGAGTIDFGTLLPLARTIVGTIAGLIGFLIVPVWAFYILRDRVQLTRAFDDALPPAWRPDVWAVLNIVERVVGRWIRAQLLLGVIVGGATFLGLLVLGNLVDARFLQFALLLAVVAGLFELLPIIGPILAMIPTLLVALTTSDPVVSLVGVLILYIAIQQIENAVLVPKIQGEALELHPSVVIFVLIVGGAIAGLPGAILAVPITAAGKSVYRYLFRRLSEDDPGVAPADAPDLRALTEPAGAPTDGTVGQPEQSEGHLAETPAPGDDATTAARLKSEDARPPNDPLPDPDGG